MSATAQRKRDLQMERTEDCAICKKTGCLTADGWYTESSLERDEDSYYMAGHGEYLGDAVVTPSGWVCSKRCRSQDMYDRADDYDKKALRKVHDACRVIAEYGKDILRFVDGNLDDAPTYLTDAASDFLEAVSDDGSDMPQWCNRETREESLEGVIRAARIELVIAAGSASTVATASMASENRKLWSDFETHQSARISATCARIAMELRDGVND